MAEGIVKFYKTTKGWGAVSCAELPVGQDVFVHFSVVEVEVEVDGYRELDPGDVVELDYEPGRQDGFSYVATRVLRLRPGPAPTLRRSAGRVVIAPAGTPDTPMEPRRRPSGDGARERPSR